MKNHTLKLNKYTIHRPAFGGDQTVIGPSLLEAVQGMKVAYYVNGCGYDGQFEPSEVVESASILGGKGGFEVRGQVDGRPACVWAHR